MVKSACCLPAFTFVMQAHSRIHSHSSAAGAGAHPVGGGPRTTTFHLSPENDSFVILW